MAKKTKGKLPDGLRKYLEKKKVLKKSRRIQTKVKKQIPSQQYPTSIAEVHKMKQVRHLLTQREQMEIDRIMPSARKSAAINLIRRRIKEMQVAKERANPMTIVKRDIMTGRDRIEALVPREKWVA